MTDFGLLRSDIAENTINSQSEEWEILEQYLMMCVRSSRVKLVQAWHVASKYNSDMFEQRCSGKQKLLCWVDSSGLDEENDIQNIIRRGITVPKSGMKFVFGDLILPGLPLFSSPKNPELEQYFTLGDKRMFHLFLCDVAVGNSYPVETEKDVCLAALNLPSEFDSIIIRRCTSNILPTSLNKQTASRFTYHYLNGEPPTHDGAQVGVLPAYGLRHNFVVFNTAQICPRYMVQLEVNPSRLELFAAPLCKYCEDMPASIWCNADNAPLCPDCDTTLHESSRLAARHTRMPLHERSRDNGQCTIHKFEISTAFCCFCRVPVCRLCLPAHDHVSADDVTAATSSLVPIGAAYKAVATTEILRSNVAQEVVDNATRKINNLKEMRMYAIKDQLFREG